MKAKTDMATTIEATKQAGRMAIQNERDATAQQIAAGVRSAKLALDKPSMQQLAGRMSQLAEVARADGDTVGYQKYNDLANQYMDQARSIPQTSAATTNESKLDLNGVQSGNIGTIAPPVAPRLGGAQVTPPAGQVSSPPMVVPSQPAIPASTVSGTQPNDYATGQQRLAPVPEGRIAVRNVRTGQIGHIPKDQAEEAMKSGYELVRLVY